MAQVIFTADVYRAAEKKSYANGEYVKATLVEERQVKGKTYKTFWDVTVWSKSDFADALTKLAAGNCVRIAGRLSDRPYLDRDGKPRAGLGCVPEAIEIVGHARVAQKAADKSIDDEDIPF